jgi:outer membrane protein assembly factor BamA
VDGYGFTEGGRFSFVNVLGKEGHIILPLTWGGTRQAAVELDKSISGGPVRLIRGGAGLFSRTNPAFEPRDFRKTIWADATSPSWMFLSVGGGAAWSDVSFGSLHDQITTYGARVSLDTRANPSFPRNAIYASAGWSVLDLQHGSAVTRYRLEARGYIGLIGSTVLSVRALSETADRPLPDYEEALLGGIDTLRGFRAGSFVGDNLAAASVELRIPLHSPMDLGQSGVTVFADAGKAYDAGIRLQDAKTHYGVGVGWYVRAPLIQLGIDVAHGLDSGTRAHVTAGLRF